MRIVAGRWRNRRLEAPRGDRTRPTADMVREAMFSALFDVEGWRVLDLFAGTGAVGLEALSRGAEHVVAVERARPAVACLQRNVAALGAEGYEVRAQPVATALAILRAKPERFDLVFADPPYPVAQVELPLILTAALDLLTEDGVCVLEHRGTDPGPEAPAGLEHTRTKRYGEAALSWYARAEGDSTENIER